MSKHNNHDWSDSKVIDDVDYHEADAQLFRNLLDQKEESSEEGSTAAMHTGEILTGKIVEISKDFVVVDVGLERGPLAQGSHEGDWRRGGGPQKILHIPFAGEEALPRIGRLAAPSPGSPRLAPGASGANFSVGWGLEPKMPSPRAGGSESTGALPGLASKRPTQDRAGYKYTLGEKQRKIFASRYKLHLPTVVELKAEIKRELLSLRREGSAS